MNGWNYTEGNPVNATDPTGQIQWQRPSSDYEKMVEWYYEATDPDNIHLEFRYVSSRSDRTTYERPDIIRPDGGDVYEIEPYNVGGTTLAVNEATYYAHELNSGHARPSMRGTLPPDYTVPYDWRDVFWKLGDPTKFKAFVLPSGTSVTSVRGETASPIPFCLSFHAESPVPGAIVWWYEINPDQECTQLLADLSSLGALATYLRQSQTQLSRPAPQPVPVRPDSQQGDLLAALLAALQQCIETLEPTLAPVF